MAALKSTSLPDLFIFFSILTLIPHDFVYIMYIRLGISNYLSTNRVQIFPFN